MSQATQNRSKPSFEDEQGWQSALHAPLSPRHSSDRTHPTQKQSGSSSFQNSLEENATAARSGQPNAGQPNNYASERKSERLLPPELSYEKSSRLGLIESKNFPGRNTTTLNNRRAAEVNGQMLPLLKILAGPGRGFQFGGGCRWRGKDGEVEIVRWRWRGGRNHRKMCHPGSVKIYGKTMSLLIGPDTTFISKGSVFANRAGHYIY